MRLPTCVTFHEETTERIRGKYFRQTRETVILLTSAHLSSAPMVATTISGMAVASREMLAEQQRLCDSLNELEDMDSWLVTFGVSNVMAPGAFPDFQVQLEVIEVRPAIDPLHPLAVGLDIQEQTNWNRIVWIGATADGEVPYECMFPLDADPSKNPLAELPRKLFRVPGGRPVGSGQLVTSELITSHFRDWIAEHGRKPTQDNPEFTGRMFLQPRRFKERLAELRDSEGFDWNKVH